MVWGLARRCCIRRCVKKRSNSAGKLGRVVIVVPPSGAQAGASPRASVPANRSNTTACRRHAHGQGKPTRLAAGAFDVIQEGDNGRDRDRTDDLYRVKVALIPTELRAREGTKDTVDFKWRWKRLSTELNWARAVDVNRSEAGDCSSCPEWTRRFQSGTRLFSSWTRLSSPSRRSFPARARSFHLRRRSSSTRTGASPA